MTRNTVRFAMTAFVAIGLAACDPTASSNATTDAVQPASPVARMNDALTINLNPLLSPITSKLGPLACVLPTEISLDIGPKGGSITAGAVTLTIPAGGLKSLTHIIALPVLGKTLAVQFYPEGLKFSDSHPPALKMNIDCLGDPKGAYVVYTDDAGHVLEREYTIQSDQHSVTAEIHHFSRYAVAW